MFINVVSNGCTTCFHCFLNFLKETFLLEQAEISLLNMTSGGHPSFLKSVLFLLQRQIQYVFDCLPFLFL